MKKKLLFIVALAFIGATTSFGQWKYGGGLSIGTEADAGDLGLGISPRVDYTINEDISISGNFTYWLTGSDYTLWQMNADVHYMFSGDEALNFYGLAGLNYSNWKVDFGPFGSYSDNKIGLNLGAGANMGMFFGELKYDTALEQLALSVGVLF